MDNKILEIIDLTHDGRGVGKDKGIPVFIKGAYPKETVIADIVKDKKSFLEGELKSILVTSPNRVKSICEDFSHCGGCDFCDYKYESQLEFKRNRVKNDLKKFTGIEIDKVEIHGMENFYNYRNNIQLTVKNGVIGYNKRGTREIFKPKNCIIAPKNTGEIIELFSNFKELKNINLIGVRENFEGNIMLVLVTKPKVSLDISDLLEKLLNLNVSHIYQNINDNPKLHYGKSSKLLIGEGGFFDKVMGYKFQISPTSFFQVNRNQVDILYGLAIDNLKLDNTDKVLELYSGIGTMTLPIAKTVEEVLGIEYSYKAVEDANKNAKINGVKNVKFLSGKAEVLISKVGTSFNKVLLDPPRSGADKEVLEAIKEISPEKIVYVSCNPATLSRDIKILIEDGQYELRKVDAVDMFALSYHVETVALLSKLNFATSI